MNTLTELDPNGTLTSPDTRRGQTSELLNLPAGVTDQFARRSPGLPEQREIPGAPLEEPFGPDAPVQFRAVEFSGRGYHYEAAIAPGQVICAAAWLDQKGFALDAITGVDWLAENEMEVVYDYFHPTRPLRAVVRTRVPRSNPELPTIAAIFPGANWHERETHDFFGIKFLGHPDLTPLLLPEDATYHPLRKDFAA
jgi:NADH-quinone oxidoreductase subunit C